MKLSVILVLLFGIFSLANGAIIRRPIGRRRIFRRPLVRPGLGLAFAGGYIAGSTRRNYYTNNYYYNSPSCDYYYDPYSCGNYYYGKRRRRSIPSGVDKNQMEEMFKEITEVDVDRCGLLLVCELARKPIPDMDELESTILAPFTGDSESDGSYYGNYNEAAYKGRNKEKCSYEYPSCESTADQILEGIRMQQSNYVQDMDSPNEETDVIYPDEE